MLNELLSAQAGNAFSACGGWVLSRLSGFHQNFLEAAGEALWCF